MVYIFKDGCCFSCKRAVGEHRLLNTNNIIVSPLPTSVSSAAVIHNSVTMTTTRNLEIEFVPNALLVQDQILEVQRSFDLFPNNSVISIPIVDINYKGCFLPFDMLYSKLINAEITLYPSLPNQSLCTMAKREKGRMTVSCVNMKLNGIDCCNFGISANKCKRKTLKPGFEGCFIKKVNLEHNCQNAQTLEILSISSGTLLSRKRTQKTKYMASNSTLKSLANFEPDLRTNNPINATHAQNMFGSARGNTLCPTKHQLRRVMRLNNLDAFSVHVDQFCELPSYLLACKQSDPDGYYCLNLLKSTYEVKDPSDGMNDMFDYAIMIPSASKHFFQNSNKTLVIDGTHMYTKWEEILLCVVGVDAEGGNVTLGIALVPQENKKYWEIFFNAVRNQFVHANMIMSDKAKGLHCIRTAMVTSNNHSLNSNLPKTVFALCAIHAMRNAKLTTFHSYGRITSLARACTQSDFDKKMLSLKKHVSPSSYQYIENHVDEFTYLGLRKTQGLQTNFGQVSNNPVEQNNNHIKTIRSSPVVYMFHHMLKCLGAQYTRKLNLAIKYRNIFKQSVCPDIAEKTLKSAKSLQNKRWTNHITHHNYSFSSTQSNYPVTLLIYNVYVIQSNK